FWTEAMNWSWQFKGADAWLKADYEKGKHFTKAELRYLPDKDLYRLSLTTLDKDTLAFEGRLKERVLTLDREDEKKKETQRIVVSLLHANRFVYRLETKPQG